MKMLCYFQIQQTFPRKGNQGETEFAESYTRYVPSSKSQTTRLEKRHPDLILESIDLANISPLYMSYRLALPEETIDSGVLSSLQMEAIVHACFTYERILPDGHRAGFFLGDGPGVGKGRTIAGLIYENFQRGRKKAIWFSASSKLQCDAEDDLRNIGAGQITVHALNKMSFEKISADAENGAVLFSSYSALIEESQSGGMYSSRLEQLLEWCGQDFNGVIVFDECQCVRSDISADTCFAVLKLQSKLPNARIIYVSSSGTSEPRNMECMVRLGLWSQGTSFQGCMNIF